MATDPADVPATARAMNVAVSTIDFSCPDGAQIPIEERAAEELGASVASTDTPVANPAFDVTPAGLISGVITERGIIASSNLGSVLP